MAPGRRKGRATAVAAAAQQQWKVGDLVLAKVKGFPPWPAMISEPQKWGYSSDRKKLFVYFFGTKQILFDLPALLELFLEKFDCQQKTTYTVQAVVSNQFIIRQAI
ncbi:unnamed protein product [Spirodela intermedia]|uniref:PWWP domain-containing protein n=2 Tax=Spirodela intermedia TaxID=51605 RepID=A0A7I8I9C3_SPIIN|nr:unnamed protein product [Spirodela intermedia]CAA6654128.1 unnamed protein product [Spirodela intermedia]CAA7388740.1 unnamed protein product [Spirodela intermedia]